MAIFDHSHLASFGRDHRARILETWSPGGTVEAHLQRHPTITPRPVAGQPPSGPSQDRTAWVNQAMTIVRHGRDPELLCRPETDSASDCSRGDRDFADAKARPAGNALNSPSLAFDPGQPANNNWLLAFGWPWHEEQSMYRAQSGRDVRNHDAAQAACRRPPGARRRVEKRRDGVTRCMAPRRPIDSGTRCVGLGRSMGPSGKTY
jgi:hypothetical protein